MTIFVVGAARSGTTMMCRVLGSHPKILGMNELHYFGDTVQDIRLADKPLTPKAAIHQCAELLARQRNGIWGQGPTEDDFNLAQRVVAESNGRLNSYDIFDITCSALAKQNGKTVACEQTPRNIFYAADILRHLPDAKIIHLIRDPRAVVASQKNRWRRKSLGGKNIPWSEVIRVWANYHPYTIAKLWRRAIIAGDQIQGHPNYFRIRFEDVLEHPRPTLEQICAFLGVDFTEEMMQVPIVGSSLRQDRSDKGFSKESVDNWRHSLSNCEIRMVESLLKQYFDQFGYSLTHPNCTFGWLAFSAKYPLHILAAMAANPRRFIIQLRAYLNAARAS